MPEAWFRAARVTSRKASVKVLAGFERHERQTWAGVGSLKAFEPLLRSPDEVCGCQGQSGNLETSMRHERHFLGLATGQIFPTGACAARNVEKTMP